MIKVTIGSNGGNPSHRPPEQHDAALRVLSDLPPTIVAGKLEALLAEVNSRLLVPVSKDTVRRARQTFSKAKG